MITFLVIIHTAISLVGLALGIPVVFGLMNSGAEPVGGPLSGPGPIKLFLLLAVLTTVTGFLFPFKAVTPAFATGILSTLIFIAMLIAYLMHNAGFWRHVWRLGVVVSLWLLVLVTIAQAFLKISPLHALAPTGTEAPFAIAQLIGLAVFVWIGWRVVRSPTMVPA